MKKFLAGALVLAATLQAQANKEYLCLDVKTGADAGKIVSVGAPPSTSGLSKIIYANLRTSTDGWILKITEGGELLNADPMVRFGRDFSVGNIEVGNFHLVVTINNRKMYCE